MTKADIGIVKKIVIYAATFIMSSCAFVDQRLDLTYDKVLQATGGSGELLIAKPNMQMIPKKRSAWIIGDVRNAAGMRTADLLTYSDIGDWINKALMLELRDAGYSVVPVNILPPGGQKGIQVTVNRLFVDDEVIIQDRLVAATTELIFGLDLWENNRKVKTLNVNAAGGEKYKDLFTAEKKNASIKKALQSAMRQVVPEIINTFEKQGGETVIAKRQATQAIGSKGGASVQKSDISDLPNVKTKTKRNAYAVVIGIEKYRQKLPVADFALNDAGLIVEYLTKVMGYPEENIITLLDEQAAKSDFEKYIEEWLPKNFDKDGTLFIYYSGLGAPNAATGEPFLVPYDGDPNFIERTGYPLKKLYAGLAKLPAKEIIVVLDSSFSGGGGKSVLAEGSRPLVMNPKADLPSASNMVVLSASSGSEVSSIYRDKGHGLLTYFMLKGLKGDADLNEDGRIEVEELYQYLKPQVQKTARRLYNNEQTPHLAGSSTAVKNVLLDK